MTDLSLIAEQEWNEARRRAFVLRPLVEFKHCPRNRAHEVAVELGLSERQVYRLIQRLRESRLCFKGCSNISQSIIFNVISCFDWYRKLPK